MNRTTSRAVAGALVLAAAACGESATSPSASTSDFLANALTTLSPGMDQLSTSFASGATQAAWIPGPGGPGRNALGIGSLLGGGLGADYVGEVFFAFGGGPGHGPHGGPFGVAATCTGGTYSATTGVVTCPSETRNGLTIARTIQFKNAAGSPQAAYDTATTNSISEHRTVTGTTTFTADSGRGRDGHGHGGPGFFGLGRGPDSSRVTITSASTTVNESSDRVVSGLATGSTQRTVNATAAGRESTTGQSSAGAFTSTRATGDTTRGLVIPVATSTNTRPYPTAGTVIRAMSATVTFTGQAAQSTTRREVITYDGSATAKLTITQDGTTKNCTIALPRGRPSCS
ncbi:hypothetical protein J421_1802 [Gemmatirosa kalamazoonensis]|uniref:Uncharacterized protein n=1 Tax=Gemmatirosa kalamazoonensis TaxID=861299 RepID=W0RE23_9BACT|nr:hypothetical protein [Gemmatirosa kalamazoonensis]AHG89339.1 hypothetical protein J421_1802 [Gemmatirosa kalamazoonensis]